MTALLMYALLHTGNFDRTKWPTVMNILLCVHGDHIQNVTMFAGGKVACHKDDWCICLTIPIFSKNLLNP